MILSENEKQIVRGINDGKFTSVIDFLHHSKLYEKTEQLSNASGIWHKTEMVLVVKKENEDIIIKELQSFFAIMTYLRNENYIEVIPLSVLKDNDIELLKDNFVLFEEVRDLISLMGKMKIVKRSSLQTFIDNNFKTPQELSFESEVKYRKNSQRISIAVGVGALLISSIFNLITYTTNRNVIITKMPNNRDTVNVRILSNSQNDLNKALSK